MRLSVTGVLRVLLLWLLSLEERFLNRIGFDLRVQLPSLKKAFPRRIQDPFRPSKYGIDFCLFIAVYRWPFPIANLTFLLLLHSPSLPYVQLPLHTARVENMYACVFMHAYSIKSKPKPAYAIFNILCTLYIGMIEIQHMQTILNQL